MLMIDLLHRLVHTIPPHFLSSRIYGHAGFYHHKDNLHPADRPSWRLGLALAQLGLSGATALRVCGGQESRCYGSEFVAAHIKGQSLEWMGRDLRPSICMYACMYACTYAHAYMHTHAHVCMHMTYMNMCTQHK